MEISIFRKNLNFDMISEREKGVTFLIYIKGFTCYYEQLNGTGIIERHMSYR